MNTLSTKLRLARLFWPSLREPSFGRAWLIPEDEGRVGYIVLTFGYSFEYLGRKAFIDEFYLRESRRGRGWGRKPLDLVEEDARAAGVRAIRLEVVRTNTAATEVYRRAGYVDHDHHLMSKWIERRFAKPASDRHCSPLRRLARETAGAANGTAIIMDLSRAAG